MKHKVVYLCMIAVLFVPGAFSQEQLGAQPNSAKVSGSGTPGFVPVWTGTKKLGNSAIFQQAGNIGIGSINPLSMLQVQVDVSQGSSTFPIVGAVLNSAAGFGIDFFSTAIEGLSQSPGVVGLTGMNEAGGTAVFGISTQGGIAGFFQTDSGDLLVGASASSGGNVFRVDHTGKGFFDGGAQTGGADFAESVALAQDKNQHEPGDLLVVDTSASRQLKLSSQPYSTLVAGIYSTKPGVLATAGSINDSAKNEVPLAIVGIVPCKVSAENGPIQPGDLLVTSSTPGRAMKGTDRSRMLGAVVGKAMESLTAEQGVIQVLVTLQ